ncbi:molybdenum cofactor guanylyltransferase [Candidatus Lucifugimonas marina]|jgi:molybdopterin-guanine dinucleotide biosynthesis protein A|uniref:Probable molybdenum cofactor guanylyltransferase n=1 Tax=Candidatus Lucifugimonas marina TaxID=3038979 RepID=A0AAJ5ZFZ3_9CHLR|nr:NTP transferase domain-containing protein [SAR202 cluster bacterium JH702]MDG0869974.1 NTP transferase domain-containing protein [SAR202 cluster bacterium JH639]WFG34697.1 NTP transferase domain-containing protein [SAR202 cluster bacterium JH545]WFG38625.1 NTP transferase domain-containing protein [SAR202 cluster bacterium JH1073]
MPAKSDITGIILGGGHSRRLGMSQSKLLIHIGGKLVLARIADTLKMVCSELVLVVRPDQDDDVPDLGIALNMHVVTDTQPYEGPLAGIHAGLAASHTPLNFVVAGDHPFVSRNLVNAMAAAATADGIENPTAVVPRTNGVLNPLHAIYPREQWTPYLAHAMSEGDRSPKYVIERAIEADYPPVTIFTDEDLEKTDPRRISLHDIDTPENLNQARKIVEARRFTPRHHSLG